MSKYSWTEGFLTEVRDLLINEYKIHTHHVSIKIDNTGWLFTIYIAKNWYWWNFHKKHVKQKISIIAPRGVKIRLIRIVFFKWIIDKKRILIGFHPILSYYQVGSRNLINIFFLQIWWMKKSWGLYIKQRKKDEQKNAKS